MCVVRRRKRRKRPLSLNIDLTLLPFSLLCPSSSSWVNTAKGDKGREDGRGKGAMRRRREVKPNQPEAFITGAERGAIKRGREGLGKRQPLSDK